MSGPSRGVLFAAYHNLPGMPMAGYQAERDALQTDVTAVQALLDQIRVRLGAIDQKCQPLDEKNNAILRALQGLLPTDSDRALLAQITGPTEQGLARPPRRIRKGNGRPARPATAWRSNSSAPTRTSVSA